MTEQYTQKNNRFYVENAYLTFDDLEKDQPEIERINVDLIGSDAELRLYPKDQVIKKAEVDGLEGQTTEDVNYTSKNFPEDLSKLIQNAGDLPKGQCIVIDGTARVTEYDDGNVRYQMWNNFIESDSFNMEVVEIDTISSNPEDLGNLKDQEATQEIMGSEEETAEEYAEDVEDLDEDEEKSEELEAGDSVF